MSAKKEKKYRAAGITRSRDLGAYAKRIERRMNYLVQRGYLVSLLQEPTGVLVMGEQREPSPRSPLMQLLGVVPPVRDEAEEFAEHGQHMHEISSRTRLLLQRFAMAANTRSSSPETWPAEFSKNAATCVKDFTANEITEASESIAKFLENYPVEPECHPDCKKNMLFLRAVLPVLKDATRLSLQ